MKIGIVTIIDNNNYGNRLQSYALCKKVEEIIGKNGEVFSLKNEPFSNSRKMFLIRLLKNIKIKSTYSDNSERMKNFEEFNKNIKFSNKRIHAYSKDKDYDFFIVGSDQVWNPYFARLREVDLLDFASPTKRISYAASFGVNNIPENLKEQVSKKMKKFKAISVREENGREIVKELTSRQDIEVLIDPTMLLSTNEWDKVAKVPHQIKKLKNKKYILNYFLGELSDKRKEEIKRIAKEKNCEIINILDKNDPFYTCGPSEFLYLEKNAYLICTDSFHSSVFGLIYNRPFIIFDREQNNFRKMNSRLETLIRKFKLKNREFKEKITEENLHHDYTEAYKILKEEQKKSEKFLLNSLDIEKKKER